ncbi:alpha/beta hydrolase [Luteolibacter sp.]|uniref:alpha/beta hydrolase n=1 Tax=Luteolibacter sp. TaxID=1962973 RepID=UPI003262EDBE
MLLVVGCANPIGTLNLGQTTSVERGYTVTRNIIYTPRNWPEKIPGDLYRPHAMGLSPAVLLIHGGGWTGKDGRWQMEPIAKQLARRGYFVLNVTYRLAPKYIYPAPVDDMREAVKWLHVHAAEQGIDPTRISSFGYSAGGYLAAMTAYTENDIRAVVAGGTPGNLALYPGGDLVPQFLGGTKQEVPQRFAEASPVNYISSQSPPTFIYHAVEDKLVPREQAWAMIEALENHDVPHEIYWIYGRDHVATFLFPADAVNQAIDFLDRYSR